MADNKNINRATILLVISMIAAVWVLVNTQKIILAGIIFITIPLISIFLYRNWSFIGGKDSELEGIDGNWIADSLKGIGVGILFIILGEIGVPGIGSIGLPPIQSISSEIGKFLIIIIAAPIAEEFFFRDILHDFFDSKLKLSFFESALIISILFALFHFYVYGESLSAAQGSFISAAIAGMVFSYLNKNTNSNAGNIACHITLNIWIGYFVLAII